MATAVGRAGVISILTVASGLSDRRQYRDNAAPTAGPLFILTARDLYRDRQIISKLRWHSRSALPPASSVDEPENDQEENCANGGGDNGGHYTRAKMDSQSGQEPIADEGADDADAKVRHEPKAGAPHDLAGKPARDQSDQ
jgi:hypothetical protein